MFYDPRNDLSWGTVHVHLKRMQIPLWSGGELYTCQLDPAGWWGLVLPYPCWFLPTISNGYERTVLKSLPIFVDLPISILPFGSVSFASCILKLCG